MNVNALLKEQKDFIRPDKHTLNKLKNTTDRFVSELKRQLVKARVKGDVFIGGSFAKGTIVRQEEYDVDILIRIAGTQENLTEMVEKPLIEASKALKMKFEKVHGSRDYFQVAFENITLEIIPVSKIAKPQQERNVTDLTYFHVPYVKRNARRLEDDIRLAKQFCAAQEVYGAESYINGFSGYALECLVIYYGSFLKMLRALSKIKVGEKMIIDPAKHYKKNEALLRINESKLKSPIVLIDPTYRERNALAALNDESFAKFRRAAIAFLSRPSKSFFIVKEKNGSNIRELAKRKNLEFVSLAIYTNRQSGDIAGTKLKKFSAFLEKEIEKYFNVLAREFVYGGKDEASFFVAARSKKEIIRKGPPVKMLKAAAAFKKAHKNAFASKGNLYLKEKISFTLSKYLQELSKNTSQLEEMAITRMIIRD